MPGGGRGRLRPGPSSGPADAASLLNAHLAIICNPGFSASKPSTRSCYRPYGSRIMRKSSASAGSRCRLPVFPAQTPQGQVRGSHAVMKCGLLATACANARARALPQIDDVPTRAWAHACRAQGQLGHVAEMETDTATIRSAVLADLVPGWRCKPARLIKRRAKFSQARCRTSSPPPSSPVPSQHQQAPPPPGPHARRPPWLRAVP